MIINSQYQLSRPEPSQDVATTIVQKFSTMQNKTVMINSATGQKFTNSDVLGLMCKIGQSLFYDYNLRKGDVVLMLSPNSPEYGLFMLGAMSIGVIVSTANPQYTLGETIYHLEDCGARLVITSPELAPQVQKACQTTGKCQKIVVFGEAPGCVPFSSLLQNNDDRFPDVKINIREDIALLPYSSGTTGRPKGVMLSHFNLQYNVMQLLHPEIGMFTSAGNERTLLFLPMFHMFGISVMFASFFGGDTLIIMPKYDLKSLIKNIKKYQPTFLPLVPPVVLQLTKSDEVSPNDFKGKPTIFYGAAPVAKELEMEFDEKFPNLRRAQGYGMTECVSGSVIAPMNEKLPYGSVGHLLPNMQAKFVDTETGKDLKAGETGELWVRGHNVMMGYYRKLEQTTHTVDSEGWLHTGDVGHMDENEFFYITDRIKELIKYKGSQVAPAELEGVLLGHPEIADCAVVGVPDSKAGELPRGYVVRQHNSKLTEQDVQKFMSEHVAPFKQLRGGVVFVESIPKSPSGKILRRLIRKDIKKEIQAKKAKL